MMKKPTLAQIKTFMKKAKRHGYDAETPSIKSHARLGVDILQYPRGKNPRTSKWFWEDAWVGSNPFSGVATVWHNRRPCWQTHYWGCVATTENSTYIYSFLRWARRQRWENSRKKIKGGSTFPTLTYTVQDLPLSKVFSSQRKIETIYRRNTIVCEVIEIKGVCL